MKQDKWSRSERNGLEHGVHLPERPRGARMEARLAWAAVHVEFLAPSANQCFPAMGLEYVTGKRRSRLVVKHGGQESGTICAKA
jgi:hypothetical protein